MFVASLDQVRRVHETLIFEGGHGSSFASNDTRPVCSLLDIWKWSVKSCCGWSLRWPRVEAVSSERNRKLVSKCVSCTSDRGRHLLSALSTSKSRISHPDPAVSDHMSNHRDIRRICLPCIQSISEESWSLGAKAAIKTLAFDRTYFATARAATSDSSSVHHEWKPLPWGSRSPLRH